MYFFYFDECGDDGFPKFSSELFILTSIYFNYQYLKSNYQKIHEFRVALKREFNLPIKEEFHTKEFLQDKNPYHGRYTPEQRRQILFKFFELIPGLKMRIINVAIDKQRITKQEYDV